MPVLPFSRPLYQKALARQAMGVMSGLQAGMNQRGARGRKVVTVDRTPQRGRVQAPHRLRMADHGGRASPTMEGVRSSRPRKRRSGS